MLYVIIIIGLFLGGCITPQQRLAQNYQACHETAMANNMGSLYEEYMRQCVLIQPGYSAPAYSAAPAYGQADAFGPMGYRGPTWEQFNGAVQNQANR